MLEGAIGVKFPQPSHTTSPEPYPNTTIIPVAQNGAFEASSYLNADYWLFAVIEALVPFGRPHDMVLLDKRLRGGILDEIGGCQNIAEVSSRRREPNPPRSAVIQDHQIPVELPTGNRGDRVPGQFA
jgi:hypothetical protein